MYLDSCSFSVPVHVSRLLQFFCVFIYISRSINIRFYILFSVSGSSSKSHKTNIYFPQPIYASNFTYIYTSVFWNKFTFHINIYFFIFVRLFTNAGFLTGIPNCAKFNILIIKCNLIIYFFPLFLYLSSERSF